jgi:uncharacterized protein (DUF1330 family)
MVAYAILDVHVFDIQDYLLYQKAVAPLLAAVGARYLARGGEFRVYEGDYHPDRLIIVEFPSLEVLDDFYAGEGYQGLKAQRDACCSLRLLAVRGL